MEGFVGYPKKSEQNAQSPTVITKKRNQMYMFRLINCRKA